MHLVKKALYAEFVKIFCRILKDFLKKCCKDMFYDVKHLCNKIIKKKKIRKNVHKIHTQHNCENVFINNYVQ